MTAARPAVLILAPTDDFHALGMRALVRRRGARAEVVDSAGFPGRLALEHRLGDASSVRLGDHVVSDCTAIWWRRPHAPRIDRDVIDGAEEQRFAARECADGLWGAVHAAGARIYNRPGAEQAAARKPYQLAVAARVGLAIPDTLITSSPEAARAFAERHEQVVYKGFNGTDLGMTDTRPLAAGDLEDLWRLRLAPVIFQEYVPLGRELRVTVVGDRVFGAEIVVNDDRARFDWRLDRSYRVRAVDVPDELADRLRLLLRELGLDSGAVDLRETPDGRIVFFEVNPSGQFMFVDAFAGTKISEAFCDMLLGGG